MSIPRNHVIVFRWWIYKILRAIDWGKILLYQKIETFLMMGMVSELVSRANDPGFVLNYYVLLAHRYISSKYVLRGKRENWFTWNQESSKMPKDYSVAVIRRIGTEKAKRKCWKDVVWVDDTSTYSDETTDNVSKMKLNV